MSEVIANRRQPMKQQQRTAAVAAAQHHPLPDVTVDFVRQVSIDSTEQRVQQQEKQQEQQSPQKTRHDETSENNKTSSSAMSSKSASARAQRLSRRHSSAAIVQPLSGPELTTTPTALAGIGGRSRSSSTRAPAGRRRIPLHEQQPSTFQQQQQQHQQQSVHWLNVPGSGATSNNKNSRSAEQLERLELLLMAPSWTCSSTTVSSSHQHRHRHPSGGSKSPSGGSRWGDASVTNSSGRDRLTVSPPLSSAPSPSQLRPHRQQHSRSQSVRAPVAGDGGRARKSSSSNNNNNNCHGGSQKKTSTNNISGVQQQQQMPQPCRPRGTSLPSNRAAAAAAAAAASAGGDSTNNGQVQFGDEDETDYYLLRHFIVHGKGNKVVNRGDSFRRLRHQQQQQQGSVSQHSSTSSISTENVAGSPPPSHPHHQHHHQQQQQQQQQAQYYSYSDHQSSSSSRRASLLGMAGPSAGLEQVSYLLGAASGSSSSTANGPEPFRVLMLGASGVGKTALTAQFMTSEYLNTYEASLDEDSCDRSVSVLLDGEESQLIFIDHPHGEISVENCMSTYNPHAYVIVYSVVDAESLRQVEEVLHFLWRHSLTSASTPLRRGGGETQSSPATTPTPPQLQLPPPPPVVILVANKIDLVRSRIISPQAGKSLATSFDCKYIETSSGMQHNVDELLVGILKQIRLKIQMTEQMFGAPSTSNSSRSLFRKRSGRRRHQHRVNYQTADDGDGSLAQGEGSCCITTAVTTTGYRTTASATSSSSSTNRRSTSLRVRRMLGKAVWTCAEYYHRNKSRSCEDLHVL